MAQEEEVNIGLDIEEVQVNNQLGAEEQKVGEVQDNNPEQEVKPKFQKNSKLLKKLLDFWEENGIVMCLNHKNENVYSYFNRAVAKEDEYKRKLAALWLEEITKAKNKGKFQNVTPEQAKTQIKTILFPTEVELLWRSHPLMKQHCLNWFNKHLDRCKNGDWRIDTSKSEEDVAMYYSVVTPVLHPTAKSIKIEVSLFRESLIQLLIPINHVFSVESIDYFLKINNISRHMKEANKESFFKKVRHLLEWIEKTEGRKRPRNNIMDEDERLIYRIFVVLRHFDADDETYKKTYDTDETLQETFDKEAKEVLSDTVYDRLVKLNIWSSVYIDRDDAVSCVVNMYYNQEENKRKLKKPPHQHVKGKPHYRNYYHHLGKTSHNPEINAKRKEDREYIKSQLLLLLPDKEKDNIKSFKWFESKETKRPPKDPFVKPENLEPFVDYLIDRGVNKPKANEDSMANAFLAHLHRYNRPERMHLHEAWKETLYKLLKKKEFLKDLLKKQNQLNGSHPEQLFFFTV